MAKKNRAFLDGKYGVVLENPDGTEAEHEVELVLRDTLRYEAMEKRSPLAGVAEDGMPSQLATLKLVWLNMRRNKLTHEQRFADFEARVLDMWMAGDDDEDDSDDDTYTDGGGVELPDPTQSAPTAD